MNPLPSRLKIALLSAAISGIVLAGFGVMIWLVICDERIAAADREIRTLASRHPGLFAGRGSYERLASSLEFTFGADYTNHVILQLKDSAGGTLFTSPHWPAEVQVEKLAAVLKSQFPPLAPNARATNSANDATAGGHGAGWGGGFGRGFGRGGPPADIAFTKAPRFFTARTGDTTWRFGVLGTDDLTLVMGLNQTETEAELNRVRNIFLLTLPAALFLVGLGGWVVAGRALRPLKVIADTAEQVTVRGLDQRIPQTTENPEAARLIQVLNRMMDRLEASFRQATRFSADASHELKTPLAIMQGELENALQSAAPGSPEQQLFSNLLEETQRLKIITRSLLLLAKADSGQLQLTLETVDLSVELHAMIEDARALATELRLQFDVAVPPQIRVEADRALLHTAMFNLISNAIKYNEPDGQISMRLERAGRQIAFTIANTGPGIPPADQPKIFDRFFRVERSNRPKIDGIGLGLSLAREIVRAHGGELVLEESRAERTRFKLTLSRAAD